MKLLEGRKLSCFVLCYGVSDTELMLKKTYISFNRISERKTQEQMVSQAEAQQGKSVKGRQD